MKLIVYICLVTLFVSSCKPELPDTDLLVKEIYDRRVAEYKNKKIRECQQKAITNAENVVDSIVHGMLQLGLADTISFPAKPARPNSPDHILGTVNKFDPNEISDDNLPVIDSLH